MYCWSIVAGHHDEAHGLLAAPFLRSLLLFRVPSYFQSRGLAHPLDGIAESTRYIPATLTSEQLSGILDRIPFELIHDYIVHGSPAEVVAWTEEMAAHGLEHVVLNDVTRHVEGGEAASRVLDLVGEKGANG
jgi:phthiodiolone/phenolphthiodiolone dimycocerosates ketoreductase